MLRSAAAWSRALLAPPRGWLLAIAALAAALSVALDAGGRSADVCGAALRGVLAGGSIRWLGPGAIAALVDWALMLPVMMLPLLAEPMMHVWRSGALRWRALFVALLVVAYAWVWLAAGLCIVPLEVAARARFAGAGYLATIGALALLHAASPTAQRGRNECHRRPRIGASGWRASLECLRFGARSALNCVQLCGLWMLLCLGAGHGHGLLMLAVQMWLIADRSFPARAAAWQLPPLLGEWAWRLQRGLEARRGDASPAR